MNIRRTASTIIGIFALVGFATLAFLAFTYFPAFVS